MPSFEFISYNEDGSSHTESFDPTIIKDAVELMNIIEDDNYKKNLKYTGFMNDSRYAQR